MGDLRLGTGSLLLAVLTIFGLATPTTSTRARATNDWARDYNNQHLYNVLNTDLSVRWQTDPFTACSAPCGRGMRHRLIRCIKDDVWSRGQIIEVPAYLCPSPVPSLSQPCNTHRCMGLWKRGAWSACSVSCGVGIQKREVKCESSLLQGQQFQVSPSECGGRNPGKTRKCHVRDCPYIDRPGRETILSENYTLVQLRKARKLKLNIGGNVKLLPGQTVVVKCPVRHYSRRLVYWSKGYKLVPFTGRVRVTSGGLRIQKADPALDGGVYTCIAGDVTADIHVEFTSKADPLSRTYRTWARKSRRRFRRRYPNNNRGHRQERGRGRKDVLVTSLYIRDGPQRDQSGASINRTQPLTYVTGDWSPCSATCGEGGERKRKVFCAHVTIKYVKMVPEVECTNQGVIRPPTVERCTRGAECPVWRPGPWTQCSPSCGRVGYKNRYLICEWDKSGTPALDNCDASKKPITRKPCKLEPCSNTCGDKSRYCHKASQLKMCRFRHFREDCCLSCQQIDSKTTSSRYSKNSNNGIDNNTS